MGPGHTPHHGLASPTERLTSVTVEAGLGTPGPDTNAVDVLIPHF